MKSTCEPFATTYTASATDRRQALQEPVVYVAQEPAPVRRKFGPPILKDLSSAQRYGKLKFIMQQMDQPSLTPGPLLRQVQRELRDFRPVDYVCYAGGDPASLSLVLLVLRDMNFREVQLLRWDRERNTSGERQSGGFYVPITMPLRP